MLSLIIWAAQQLPVTILWGRTCTTPAPRLYTLEYSISTLVMGGGGQRGEGSMREVKGR
jgi:hypothetical protein